MKPSIVDDEARIDAYMAYLFESLGLAPREEWRPGVKEYFLLSARMASILDGYALDIPEDLAPVFYP